MAGENGDLTLRYVADLVEKLRVDTREARHDQSNKLLAALGELRRDMDLRLRAIELDNAASAPTTIGPRLQQLERWQGALDENQDGGAPRRIATMEARWDRVDGALLALKAAVAILSVVNVVLAVIVTVQALT